MFITRAGLAILAALLIVRPVQANDNTWNNAAGNFIWSSTANNWSLSPFFWDNGADGTAIFSSSAVGVVGAINVTSAVDVRGFNFQVDGYTINGASVITLVNGGSSALGIIPGEIRVNPGVTATINAVMAGSVNLTKTGTGILVVGGNNTYTGATLISNGTLSIDVIANGGVASRLGMSTNAAANLVIGSSTTTGTLRYTGATATTDRGATLGSTGGIVEVTSNQLTIDGQITGAGQLTKAGIGNLILTNAGNNYSGGTRINLGNVLIGDFSYLGSGSLTFAGASVGGSAEADAVFTWFTFSTGSSAKNISLLNTGGRINAFGPLTLSGTISGSGGLTISNDVGASVTLTGSNSYTGPTVVNNGGVLIVNSLLNGGFNSPIGASTNDSSNLVLGGVGSGGNGTLQFTLGSITLFVNRGFTLGGGASGIIDITAFTTTLQFLGQVTGGGQLVKNGPGNLSLPNNSNNYSGGTRVNQGHLEFNNFNQLGSGPLTLAGSPVALSAESDAMLEWTTSAPGSTAKNVSLLNTGGAIRSQVGAITFSGTISGSGGLTIQGFASGAVFLTGSNSYTGPTVINNNGILVINSIANGGVNSPIGASTNASANLVLGGVGTGGNGTLRYTGVSDLSTNRGITLGAGAFGIIEVTSSVNYLWIRGNITGGGALQKSGAGTLFLGDFGATTNSYSGGTTVSAGTLLNVQSDALPTTGALTVNATYSLNTYSQTVGAFAGSGTVTSLFGFPSTFTVNQSSNTTYSGQITSNLSLTKTGMGNLTLSGNSNTYFGPTTINGGSLIIASTGQVLPNGNNVTINTGGTLNYGNGANIHNNSVPLGTLILNGGTLRIPGGAGGLYINHLVIGASGGTLDFTGAAGYSLNFTGANPVIAVNANSAWIGGGTSVMISISAALLTFTIAPNVTLTSSLPVANGVNQLLGGGTLFLSNPTTEASANFLVESGTLRVDNMSHLIGTVTLAGTLLSGSQGSSARFQYGGATASSAKDFTLEEAGGNFNVSTAATTLTLSGAITGTGGLFKTGPGTLIISGTSNIYDGGTTINAGTLSVAADNRLGPGGGEIVVNALGTFSVTTSFTTNRPYTLIGGKISVNSGQTLTFNNSTVGGGFLTGAFATQAGSSNTFAGGTLNVSGNLTLNGSDTFSNYTLNGTASVPATRTATFAAVTLGASGSLTVGGTVNGSDLLSYGLLTINNGGTLNNSLSNMTLGGGSRTFVGSVGSPGGLINIGGGGLELRVNGGLLVNNGSIGFGTVVADFGGYVKGAGVFQSVLTQNGGIFSPGNSPGTALIGTTHINGGGGILNIDIDAAGLNGTDGVGTAGSQPGWGRIKATDELRITATTANPLTITLTSLQLGGGSGAVYNFDNSKTHQWEVIQMQAGTQLFMTASGGGAVDPSTYVWDPNIVTINTNAFQNSLNGGSFSSSFAVNEVGSYSVYVNFTPTPEPGSILAIAALGLGLVGYKRRREQNEFRSTSPRVM